MWEFNTPSDARHLKGLRREANGGTQQVFVQFIYKRESFAGGHVFLLKHLNLGGNSVIKKGSEKFI